MFKVEKSLLPSPTGLRRYFNVNWNGALRPMIRLINCVFADASRHLIAGIILQFSCRHDIFFNVDEGTTFPQGGGRGGDEDSNHNV